jgi:hypothetical protein
MEQFYSYVVVAGISFIIGIAAGITLFVFAQGKGKKSDVPVATHQDKVIASLNNEVKWLEEALQKTMGVDDFEYLQEMRAQLKKQVKDIIILQSSNNEWREKNLILSDEITTLEEANKSEYKTGYANGRLAIIKEMDNAIAENSERGNVGLTGQEMIRDSTAILNKSFITA